MTEYEFTMEDGDRIAGAIVVRKIMKMLENDETIQLTRNDARKLVDGWKECIAKISRSSDEHANP